MASGNAQIETAPRAFAQRISDQRVGIFRQCRVGVEKKQRVAGAKRGAGVEWRAASARCGDHAVGKRLRQSRACRQAEPPSTTMISAPRGAQRLKRLKRVNDDCRFVEDRNDDGQAPHGLGPQERIPSGMQTYTRERNMTNPILVEVIRGAVVESRHRGAVAVADAAGRTVFCVGDIAVPVFPRSAIKALQALPLVETGAADRYGFGDEELALACASHSGEAAHVAGVERMLAKTGLASFGIALRRALADGARRRRRGRAPAGPSALHNNCSGKHAGFLCLACAMGVDTADYFRPEHPVQSDVRAMLEDFTGVALGPRSAPSTAARCRPGRCRSNGWRMALPNSALVMDLRRDARVPRRGCARLARDNRGSSPVRDVSAPRSCSASASRVFVKTGAEGVYCGALPEQGLGIAVKCDDGAGRAAQAIMAAVIARFLPLDAAERAALEPFMRPVLRNWNGFKVGAIRPPTRCDRARLRGERDQDCFGRADKLRQRSARWRFVCPRAVSRRSRNMDESNQGAAMRALQRPPIGVVAEIAPGVARQPRRHAGRAAPPQAGAERRVAAPRARLLAAMTRLRAVRGHRETEPRRRCGRGFRYRRGAGAPRARTSAPRRAWPRTASPDRGRPPRRPWQRHAPCKRDRRGQAVACGRAHGPMRRSD